MTPKPYPGLPVLYAGKYQLPGGKGETGLVQYPAVVTSVEADGKVNLTVFTDHHVVQIGVAPVGTPTAVPYSADGREHSWQPSKSYAEAEPIGFTGPASGAPTPDGMPLQLDSHKSKAQVLARTKSKEDAAKRNKKRK